jgi:hypothetical protein
MNRKTDPEGFEPDELRKEENRLCSLHHKWLKELFVAVRGNGNVEHGLEWRTKTLLANQEKVLSALDEIIKLKPSISDSFKFVDATKKMLFGMLEWTIKGGLAAIALLILWASAHGWKL